MSGSRLISFGRVVMLVGGLSLAGAGIAQAQETVAIVADSPVTTFWEQIMQTLTNAKNVADEAWQKAQTVITQATTTNTAATGAAVINSTKGLIAANSQLTDASIGANWDDSIRSEYVHAAINKQITPITAALCTPATLTMGLASTTAGVANILKQTLPASPGSCAPGNVTAGTGAMPSDCTQEFNPTKSTSQRVQDMYNLITNTYCEAGSDLSAGCPDPHADTDVNSFYTHTTFAPADIAGMRTFADLVCGLPPENTPKSPTFRPTAGGQGQLVNQHAQIAAYNLCVQTFDQFNARRQPTVSGTVSAAVATIYSAGAGLPAVTGVSAMSRDDLLKAVTQGVLEAQSGADNVITQMGSMHGEDSLKVISAALMLNNYMQYEHYQLEEEMLNVNTAILAHLNNGGTLK